MDIKRFDVLRVDLSDAQGSEQGGVRPCVVVGNDLSNKYSPVILVMPLTTQMKKRNIPTHQIIKKEEDSGLTTDSLLLGEQPRPVDRRRIKKRLGKISNCDSQRIIDKACLDAFFYAPDGGQRIANI